MLRDTCHVGSGNAKEPVAVEAQDIEFCVDSTGGTQQSQIGHEEDESTLGKALFSKLQE